MPGAKKSKAPRYWDLMTLRILKASEDYCRYFMIFLHLRCSEGVKQCCSILFYVVWSCMKFFKNVQNINSFIWFHQSPRLELTPAQSQSAQSAQSALQAFPQLWECQARQALKPSQEHPQPLAKWVPSWTSRQLRRHPATRMICMDCYGAAMVLLLCCYSYYSCHCSGWGYTLRYTSGVRSITLHGPCIAAIQSNNYYSWSHGTSKDHVFGLGFQSMDATSFKSWNVMELSPKHDTHIQIVSELYINNQPTLSMILYVCPLLPDSKASLESKELIQCLKTSIDVRRRYSKIMWYHAAWCEYVRRLCSRSMP